jgi:hypothetical protein
MSTPCGVLVMLSEHNTDGKLDYVGAHHLDIERGSISQELIIMNGNS